jgi:hypothetical protein
MAGGMGIGGAMIGFGGSSAPMMSGGIGGYGGLGGYGPIMASGLQGAGGMGYGFPFAGAAGAMLAGGANAQPRMTPAQTALHTAQEQLHHFVGQVQQLGMHGEALAPLERDLEQMRQAGHEQPTLRLQALHSALSNLHTLGKSAELPTEGKAYLHGLHERLQELAHLAGGHQIAQP